MGLTYHYSFEASPETTPQQLAEFLRGIERDAQAMGFAPTLVVDGAFDRPERKAFARRAACPLTVEDARLKGADLPDEICWTFLKEAGVCRMAPNYGVMLVLTDERGGESVFGFFRYPPVIHDRGGRELMRTPAGEGWYSSGHMKSPDPRYREIVRRFRAGGYVAAEQDDFVLSVGRAGMRLG